MEAISKESLMIGTGSDQAVVGIPDVINGGLQRVFTFPEGHGAYAIDFKGSMALAASRLGRVGFTLDVREAAQEPSAATVLRERGAEALGVALTEGEGAAVAGVDGLWYWPSPHREPARCTHLPVNGHALCSTIAVNGVLFALSTGGELYRWRLSDLASLGVLRVPFVGRRAALVHLQYWPEHDLLAFPGRNGELVLCARESGQVVTVPLHDGEFYVVCRDRHELVTVGRNDGKIGFVGAPQGSARVLPGAPANVTAGAMLPSLDFRMFLITGTGGAGVYALSREGLSLGQTLEAKGWRSVVGLSGAEIDAVREQLRKAEVRRIADLLRTNGSRMSSQEREQLHCQLVNLGAEPVSLEVKAQAVRAKRSVDPMAVVQEVELRKRQETLLRDEPYAVPYLTEYANVLEMVWQPHLAMGIYTRLRSLTDDHAILNAAQRVGKLADAVHREGAIIELDEYTPIDVILAASDVLEVPMSGRFAFAQLDPFACDTPVLDWDMVASKFEQLCRETGHGTFAPPIRRDTLWLRGSQSEVRGGLFFSKDTAAAGITLEVAYTRAPAKRIVQPVLAVAAVPSSASCSPQQARNHNDSVRKAVEGVLNGGPSEFWRSSYKPMREAVWRTATSLRGSMAGGDYT